MEAISRWRATLGLLVGAGTLAFGAALRFLPQAQGTGPSRIDAEWLAIAAAIALAALTAGWFARPPRDALVLLGLAPLGGALGLGMLLLGAIDDKARDLLIPAAVEVAGGAAFLAAAVHLVQARAARSIPRLVFDKNLKVRLRREDGSKLEVPAGVLVTGDEIQLSPGEDVPVDGTIVSGSGFVDESVLNGAALPSAKQPGDPVFAGSKSAIPELVVRAAAPLQESLLAQREELTASVIDELLAVKKRGVAATVASALVAIVCVFAIVLRRDPSEVERWLPEVAGLFLACLGGAPALAIVRGSLETLRIAGRKGLILGRAKDLYALGSVRRWQIDPELLAVPGEVEVLALGDEPAETLLAVAEALLADDPSPERASISAALRRKNVKPRSGAALRRSQGVYYGTVAATRWSLGAEHALEAEQGLKLEPQMQGSIAFLRERGLLMWLVVKPDDGIVGAIGVGLAADEEVKRAAERLTATVMPGLPDSTRKALATAAGIACDGPPLGRRDATLLAEGSPPPSTGLRVRVLSGRGKLELAGDRTPRLLRSSLFGLGDIVEIARRLDRRAQILALALVAFPAALALALLFLGLLSPISGAAVGAISLLLTRVRSG